VKYHKLPTKLSKDPTTSSAKLEVAGVIGLQDSGSKSRNNGLVTEAAGALIDFGINDGTSNRFGGAYTQADQGGLLRFDTRSGTPLFTIYGRSAATASDGTLLVSVLSNGNVGIGTSGPGVKLDIVGGSGRVQAGNSWLTNSDVRLKTNITTLDNALPKLLRLRGVRYDLKTDVNSQPGQGKIIGFIAQELEKEYPELVFQDENGMKAVSYDKLTAILVEAIKAQEKRISEMEKELKTLKAKVK
jgi:hypothetical protein